MTMFPTISLIIPVYNSERWLHRCLDSIVAQNYKDYEVVLVDDGSTDGSAKILDAYAEQDSRFRVLHEPNRGSSLARKVGLDHARGEWIVFADSDDDVHPDYLCALYDAVCRHHLMIAACDMQKVADDGIPAQVGEQPAEMLGERVLYARFFNYDFWGFWGKIYHATLFTDLYFPEYNINEDYVVMSQIFLRTRAMAYVPRALYYYRANSTSQSHYGLSSRIMDEYYNKKWVLDYYEQQAPRYGRKARAQLVETTIKLLNIIIKEDTDRTYVAEDQSLKLFLRKNILFILFRSDMLLGLKLMSLKLII